MKKVVSMILATVLLLSMCVTVLAVDIDGGVWDYGTNITGINRKTVYSNFFHPTKVHRSSVTIGTTYADSGWVLSKQTSYASAEGSWGDDTHAYYDYQ